MTTRSSAQRSPIPLMKALLVTFLWSSSYVLIKIGLLEISPLTFVALRYSFAFLILLFVSIMRGRINSLLNLSPSQWLTLIVIGAFGYAGAQGLQFIGLNYLPVVTTSFLLNFTPVFVAFLGIPFLHEIPTKIQAVGILTAILGAYLFFQTPIQLNGIFGILIVLLSGICWAIYMILVRGLQRSAKVGTLELTTATMGVGALILLISSLIVEGMPSVTSSGWAIILWLSLVNTAFAFYLWNQALTALRAYELSILQNTMLVQTSLLAWTFLNEQATGNMLVGIILVLCGVTLVQLRRSVSQQH